MSDITWTPDVARLDSLDLWQHNPKQISKRRADRLLTGWQELGQFQTLAVGPDGECYDGHQRVKMLAQAGFPGSYEIAVLRASRPLTDAERRGVIMHSTLDTGQFDWDALAGWESAGWLDGFGFDADLLADWNTDAHNLSLMLEAQAAEIAPPEDVGPQVDRAEELQEQWQVQAGDVWRAGEHFVICGDCREPETWARLLTAAGVEKLNGVFTSPPYAEQRKAQYGGVPTEEYVEWWEAVQANVRANLATDGSFFVNIKPHCEDGERVLYVFDLVLAMKRRWGWRYVGELCWKQQGYPGDYKGRFKNQFEPIYHFSFSGHKHRPNNVLKDFSENTTGLKDYSEVPHIKSRSQSNFEVAYGSFTKYGKDGARPGNVIEISTGATSTDSGSFQAAAFPVALPAFFVKAYSDAGDVWCDPFLGSGTTIVAAHQNGRRGLGIERLEKYVAVTLQRLADLGLEPQRVTR